MMEKHTPNANSESSNSSLTLSITPPLPEAPEDTSTISEHLSSIENDRSVQEIQISNLPESFSLLLKDVPDEHISQEPKPSLNSSFNTSSIISLNGLEKFMNANMESRNNAQSVLEEILNNEQFKSEDEESLNIFANVDLDDKLLSYNEKNLNFNLGENSYNEVCKRVRDFEELVAIKDNTIAALTTELDSFRELLSNTSTNSLGTSTTEYRQFQEECHNKLVEYQNAVIYRDAQIEKLQFSLEESIASQEKIKEHLKNEILQLQKELDKASVMLKERNFNFDFEKVCSNFEKKLDPKQVSLFQELKVSFNSCLEKNRNLVESEGDYKDKVEKDVEIAQLRDALAVKDALESKHSKEMEELRTYFEKKCADLEKNYSEEVFSQQSRKMSSSSCSEAELSSDFIMNQPGPGGDTKLDYTKKDISKLKVTLSQLSSLIDEFDLNSLDEAEFEKIKSELGKIDLKSLIKYDLVMMQNKYHAELEILREDFDNRVDVLNLEQEEKIKILEKKYLEEIDDLNTQLRGRIVSTAQQEVANSGEFEIDEVVQSYERRLQEQVTLAKLDLITSLEIQIQRLVASESLDDDWPEELLQLKARFSEKYQTQIEELKMQHNLEISKLKEEHSKNLERTRRRSLRDVDSLSKGEMELLKERDSVKKQNSSLKNLIGELIKYFTQCEDELNNTLVEELVTKNLTQIEKDLDASPFDSLNNVKRVHITPNFNDLINLIDKSSEEDLDSIDLKSELGSCLEKLKADANAILHLSTTLSFTKDEKDESNIRNNRNSLEKEISSLTRKLIDETQIKSELAEQLQETKSLLNTLENNRNCLENQVEQLLERETILEDDLMKAKEKISELIENGHKEIVSEGYGESGDRSVRGLVEAVATLANLQEKMRAVTENPNGLDANVVKLLEDLARAGSRIAEEAKREKDDCKQQIDAADKKYKVTCRFMEEQAAEREQERDDAQKEIASLKEQLKEKDKDRANFERVLKEVDQFEHHMREMSKQLENSSTRQKLLEEERQEAVDKIYELRDIIRDLEDQIRLKSATEEELRSIVDEFETLVKREKEAEVRGSGGDAGGASQGVDVSDVERLHQYVAGLESEVQKLRLSNEIAGSEGTLQQLKNHLCDLETTLDKRTKDLEGLHSTVSTTCSSPSEDMSIRDVVHHDKAVYDECEVPLQQLARLKDKLLRHSRAEDAALKRIRDLELQILSLKSDLEESQTEREILKKQISDHLVLISNLQIRLDEQRIRAEHIEKQTNTSLEVQNYDLKNTIASLEERISKRDKNIAQLKQEIEETRKRLEERERELSSRREDELLVQMQEEVEILRSENLKLKSKLNKHVDPKIDKINALNLSEKDIETVGFLKISGDLEILEQGRRAHNDSLAVSPIGLKTKTLSEPEISSIDKIHSGFFHSLQIGNQKANSTEKHVRFEDEIDPVKVEEMRKLIHNYEERFEKFKDVQDKIEALQKQLEETESNLVTATETFQEEQKQKEERIIEKEQELEMLHKELEDEKKRALEREKELRSLQKLKKIRENEVKSHEETMKLQNEELKKMQEETLHKIEEVDKLKCQNSDLNRDLQHLQALMIEKEKIIEQMENDSKSLHHNLETIQKKMLESGNVVDLSKRLREEQKKNQDLYEELHELKAQLLAAEKIEDITEQVRKELDYSMYLDSTLINAVSDGSSESEDLEVLKISLKKYKSVNKQLVKAKEAIEKKFEDLEKKYEELKKELDTVQFEDAKLIGQLRMKLDDALNKEIRLDRILKIEKDQKTNLENKVKILKDKISENSTRSLPPNCEEFGGLTRMISTLEEENNNLRKEVMLLKEESRSVMNLRNDETLKLENRFIEATFNERIMKETIDKLQDEVSVKSRELSRTKKIADELDLERRKLSKHLEEKNKSTQSITDQLFARIKELNDLVKNDRQLVNVIEKLTHENGLLEEKIAALEDRKNDLPFDDPMSRANYLFAKYLRSESYRKALTWQKKYLIMVLESYQQTQIPNKEQKRKTRKPTFKILGVMVVSIIRMKYLVRRWHSGKRITGHRVTNQQAQFQVGQPVSSQNFSSAPLTKSALNQPKTEMPWFGTSPPVKEPSALKLFSCQPKKSEASSFQKKQESSGKMHMPPVNLTRLSTEMSTLSSPAILSKYIERFNQIQERLGLDSSN